MLNFNEFKWRAMTEAINQIKRSPRLLQDLVFKVRKTNPTDIIDVDVVIGGKKLVPFVSPIEGGTVIEKLGREMRSIKTPRLRPKKPFTAQELLTTRSSGAGFYAVGSEGISGARRRKVGEELSDLRNRIDVTTEWMCAQALTGALTVDQDNLAFAVNYQIPAAHKPVLEGTAKWDDIANSNPIKDFQDWVDLIVNALGYGPDIAILGTGAATSLTNNEKVLKKLDNRRIEAGSFTWKATSNYLGNLGGIDLFRYGSQYEAFDGTPSNFIAADKVILIATQARFSIEYGLIMDLEAEAQVMAEYFSKSWIEKDPSILWMLAESRPLPVPWQPEAIVFADVQ